MKQNKEIDLKFSQKLSFLQNLFFIKNISSEIKIIVIKVKKYLKFKFYPVNKL